MVEDKDFFTLAMSAIAIFVSIWAKRDSKRSADAAERSSDASILSAEASKISAHEGRISRKLIQSDQLLPKFNFAEGLWGPIFKKQQFPDTYIGEAENAIRTLKLKLGHDTELIRILDRMVEIANSIPLVSPHSQYDKSWQTPSDAASLKEEFDQKKNEYLNIG